MSEPTENTEQTPVAPVQSSESDPPSNDPKWLPKRLEQARRSAEIESEAKLKALGAQSYEDLQAKLKRLSELENERMSETEKVQKQIDELAPKAAQADRLRNMFSSVVDAKFSELTEQQRNAIDTRAGGDAEKRWEMMDLMQAAGMLHSQPTNTARPAQTIPQASPPPSPVAPQTAKDKFVELGKTDTVGAALFHQINASAIQRS